MTLTLHMIGNAHLDPVWLWPWQTGLDEALATFRSAADRCDEEPTFIFTRGEAWLFAQVERLDPDLFERIRRLVREGRWMLVGDAWVQPDLNLPLGEALTRQWSVGRAWFESRFGTRSDIAYNVDSFGHPATFPDLARAAGMRRYVIQRPKPFQMVLPTAFRWRGAEGGVLDVYRMAAPYLSIGLNDLQSAIDAAISETPKGQAHAMCFYGVGNHGGGPSREQIAWIADNRHSRTGVEMIFSSPDRYFDSMQNVDLPLIEGDLQHCFPGCYVVMHDIKQAQRRIELKLLETEACLSAFPVEAEQTNRMRADLERAWRDVLFTAFHDIAPGTAVASAWGGVRAMQGRAEILADEVLADVTRRWSRTCLGPVAAHQHIFINPYNDAFEGLVEFEPWLEDYVNWDDRWLSDESGQTVPFQLVQPQSNITAKLVAPLAIPARGSAALTIRTETMDTASIDLGLQASQCHMGNDRLDIALGRGGIGSINLDGLQIWGDRTPAFGLHLRDDPADCWGMASDTFDGEVLDTLELGDWSVEETGPLRARVAAEGRLGTSRILIVLTLELNTPRIDIHVKVNFDERRRLLQARFGLAAENAIWRDGLPGGWLQRSEENVEHPFQRWTCASVGGIDSAILTHDAYSLSRRGSTLDVSLLRAPIMANAGNTPLVYTGRDTFTDQGLHYFDLALQFGKELSPESLDQAARRTALPPIHFDRYDGMSRPLPPAANPTPPNSMVTAFTLQTNAARSAARQTRNTQ